MGFQREIPGPDAADSAEAQFDWLGDFGSVLSHDLKTPLAVLKGNLDLIEETGDLDYLDAAIDATNRIESLVDDLANVMTQRNLVCDVTTVELADAFRSWDVLGGDRASFEVVDSKPILADERALARLADNLVKNTVEHAGPDVPMRIGTLPDGFYYEDAGPGIPPENRADAFEPGFSTKADGTGFGMVSVEQIAAAHGWDVSIAESPEGGARFEFTGVEDPTEESVRR
nr:HAMP domain-containing sensor histidine kinase [Halogeometricum limi]